MAKLIRFPVVARPTAWQNTPQAGASLGGSNTPPLWPPVAVPVAVIECGTQMRLLASPLAVRLVLRAEQDPSGCHWLRETLLRKACEAEDMALGHGAGSVQEGQIHPGQIRPAQIDPVQHDAAPAARFRAYPRGELGLPLLIAAFIWGAFIGAALLIIQP